VGADYQRRVLRVASAELHARHKGVNARLAATGETIGSTRGFARVLKARARGPPT